VGKIADAPRDGCNVTAGDFAHPTGADEVIE
jgi:hypothetical protein